MGRLTTQIRKIKTTAIDSSHARPQIHHKTLSQIPQYCKAHTFKPTSQRDQSPKLEGIKGARTK